MVFGALWRPEQNHVNNTVWGPLGPCWSPIFSAKEQQNRSNNHQKSAPKANGRDVFFFSRKIDGPILSDFVAIFLLPTVCQNIGPQEHHECNLRSPTTQHGTIISLRLLQTKGLQLGAMSEGSHANLHSCMNWRLPLCGG